MSLGLKGLKVRDYTVQATTPMREPGKPFSKRINGVTRKGTMHREGWRWMTIYGRGAGIIYGI